MKDEAIKLLAFLIAAIIVMIVHEVPKSIVYIYLNPLQSIKDKKSILKLRQYIDPIGLIFFITSSIGFSRPFMYRIKDKKTNFTLGIVGLTSSLIFMLLFYSMYLMLFRNMNIYAYFSGSTLMIDLYKFIELTVRCLVLFNFSVFLINLLFPVPPFDMSLIIASKSPKRYFTLYQYEKLIQLLLIMLIAFNVFSIILGTLEGLLFF